MADLTVSFSDKALNRTAQAVMTQRPSAFNYACPTVRPVTDPSGAVVGSRIFYLLCVPVPLPPGADPATFPRVTRVAPFPFASRGPGLPWCLQITGLQIDFTPSDTITLPPELGGLLPAEGLAFEATATFGLGCPDQSVIDALGSVVPTSIAILPRAIVLPVDRMDCFTLRFVARGHFEVVNVPSGATTVQRVRFAMDGLEIVDLAPAGLESAVECYLTNLLRLYVLPRLVYDLAPFVVSILGVNVTVTPTLTPGVSPNPDVSNDAATVSVDFNFT